jgi:hypothetical protein
VDGCAGVDSPQLLEINPIEAFGRGMIKGEKPHPSVLHHNETNLIGAGAYMR